METSKSLPKPNNKPLNSTVSLREKLHQHFGLDLAQLLRIQQGNLL